MHRLTCHDWDGDTNILTLTSTLGLYLFPMNYAHSFLPEKDVQVAPGNYAVIFVHHTTGEDMEAYAKMDDATLAIAQSMDGFLGFEFTRIPEGVIFVSYWKDKETIAEWGRHPTHIEAKVQGRAVWYAAYRVLVARVESASLFNRVQS